jgi:hypothetical protein
MNAGHQNLKSTLRHGNSRKGNWSPEYYSWASMIQRCTNPKRNVWHLYGGRGIKVCERWKLFDAFLADMGPRPDEASIGRIDPDGDYCPENCEWQAADTQARQRRNNKLTDASALAIRSSAESQRVLAARFGVSRTMIRNIKRGDQWR